MRALKAVVLALGMLCLGAFGVLVYLVVSGMGKPAEKPLPTSAATPDTSGLGLPSGSQIVSIAATGDLLALHVRLPDAGDRVVIVDPRTGAVRLKLDPGSP